MNRGLSAVDRMASPDADSNAGGTVGTPSRAYPPRTAGPVPTTLTHSLRELLERDDGWLRAIPTRDKQPCYLKWKFTHGPWERHYVMVVVASDGLQFGFELLLRKLSEVDAGLRKPTRDKLHDGYQEGDNLDA